MIITHKLEMDLVRRSEMPRIDVVQGDSNTRVLELTLKCGGEDWTVPETAAVAVRYCKSDGTKGYYDTLPDGIPAWAAEGNVLRVTLAPQMLTAEGPVFAQIEMTRDADMLATFTIQIRVEGNPGAGAMKSEDYVNWLRWAEGELAQLLEQARDSGEFLMPVDYEWKGTVLEISAAGKTVSADLRGPRGLRGETGKASPILYVDAPYTVIDLTRDHTSNVYSKAEDGTLEVHGTLSGFSAPEKCPRYMGWRLKEGAALYLYIGDLTDGEFVPDPNFEFSVYGSNNLFNYMLPKHNRIVEIGSGKYFCYRISGDAENAVLIGMDNFPASQMEHDSLVPNYYLEDGTHRIWGRYNSIVLPCDSYYAVLHGKKTAEYDETTMNVAYEYTQWDEEAMTEASAVDVTPGACFGYIPADAGAALLTIPSGCPLEDLTVYTSKPVKMNAKTGKRRKALELGRKLIRDFSFVSRKSILWNKEDDRYFEEGCRFYGVPYSSRWKNAHYVGFEVSALTALNALNDPYSIAYDGAVFRNADKEHETLQISEKKEIGTRGGPGYGLVCSAFVSLLCGNPYPQSNQGFTYDKNFEIVPAMDISSGMVLMTEDLGHCAVVDEIYDEGCAILEASNPCMAKSLLTSTLENQKYMNHNTNICSLDSYGYAVANLDRSGYDRALTDVEGIEMPGGMVRPWRGHKAVYGPWDKSDSGCGIGITIQDGIAVENGEATVLLYIPVQGKENTWTVREIEVAEGTRYLDLAKWENEEGVKTDLITVDGTYKLGAVGSDVVEQFRYYSFDSVVLSFDAEGKARFTHEDGTAADEVLYVYVRVKGYGGRFAGFDDENSGPMVIAAGKAYPELAADTDKITAVYSAIVEDPALDSEGKRDSWGRFSCLCRKEDGV